MAIIRNIPRNKRMPSLRGAMMVDTCRGVLRVRKWPKKRGTPRSALQRWWNDWFRQANLLTKYADGMTQARAIALTKYTGLYPRDIMLRAIRGRYLWFTDQDGKAWYPMAAIQDVSDTLDILAQAVGSVLVRAVDRWRPAGPAVPVVGQALTYQGAGLPPLWQTPGAGVSQQALPSTPIIPDNTKTQYDLDVSGFAELDLVFENIGFASGDRATMRFSTDGGGSFHSGAADYPLMFLSDTTSSFTTQNRLYFSSTTPATGHQATCRLTGLRAGRASASIMAAVTGGQAYARASFAAFDGPITDIRILSAGGANFNAGTIHVIGIVAA